MFLYPNLMEPLYLIQQSVEYLWHVYLFFNLLVLNYHLKRKRRKRLHYTRTQNSSSNTDFMQILSNISNFLNFLKNAVKPLKTY